MNVTTLSVFSILGMLSSVGIYIWYSNWVGLLLGISVCYIRYAECYIVHVRCSYYVGPSYVEMDIGYVGTLYEVHGVLHFSYLATQCVLTCYVTHVKHVKFYTVGLWCPCSKATLGMLGILGIIDHSVGHYYYHMYVWHCRYITLGMLSIILFILGVP